ncbi:hypothetical protein BKA58DRAFT_371472 [Alternaria rosae]|uniref:uncharacterized protein n=1 Tax=Alternaria rosae TaxID=1187941 RepID=UPI001E8ED07F|nr:uncharacterized protein BKA58DRAFT_371472 [Alternaria rosae]KAH6881387.1 hypothetical protein BKA58DRAFT_371472 [Alternaria rosae]
MKHFVLSLNVFTFGCCNGLNDFEVDMCNYQRTERLSPHRNVRVSYFCLGIDPKFTGSTLTFYLLFSHTYLYGFIPLALQFSRSSSHHSAPPTKMALNRNHTLYTRMLATSQNDPRTRIKEPT